MKKMIKRFAAFGLAALSLFGTAGCDWKVKDVNDIVDNAFENYQKMNSTETGEYKNFKSINVASSYLGYGYDVINDPYMDKDAINFSAPILDMQKIETAQLKMIKENTSDVEEHEGATMQELYNSYAASLSVYGKAGKMFSGGLRVDYSGSESEKGYWYFYKNVYSVKTFNIYMVDSVSTIRGMLSAEFENDLLTMEAGALYDKYGTHLIKEAVMGGRMEISSAYSSTTSSSTTSVQAAVNAHIKFLKSASVNTEASASYENALSKENVQSNTKIKQFGGALVDTHSREALASNYSKWVESFDQSLEYAALSGVVGENSLLGLWELLPAGNETRAEELQDKFIELSENSYDELCARFKLKEITGGGEKDTSWTALHYKLERKNSNDGENYNPQRPSTDQGTLNIHNGYEIGEAVVYGCAKNANGVEIKNRNDFSIKYKILEDIADLPRQDEGTKLVKIESDAATSVHGTNINSTVGMGAYWVRVTYTDGSQNEYNAVDFMRNKGEGSIIELFSEKQLDKSKVLKKIELVVAYEIYYGGPGFLGIWWNAYANWRCEYTFDFV